MQAIRGQDTKPEMVVRRGLHRRGLRFRIHRRDLPGTPDLVFPGRRVAVFVHGCFWHMHDCRFFRLPSTNRERWQTKLEGNRARDQRNQQRLSDAGWRVVIVWECDIRSKSADSVEAFLDDLADRIRS